MSVTPDTEKGKTARRIISRHEEIRRRCGYSVTGLAAAIGFSHAYVSRVEGGTLKPSSRYRAAVARKLEIPESLIFEEVAAIRRDVRVAGMSGGLRTLPKTPEKARSRDVAAAPHFRNPLTKAS